MRRFLPLSALSAILLVGSCVGTDSPVGSAGKDIRLDIPVRPALIPSPADAGALPIHRIRARATKAEDNIVVGEVTIDVDPTATSWTIDLAASIPGEGLDVFIYVFLIHVEGETETIQFSGVVGPIAMTPGGTVEAPDIPIVRGPIANSFVTDLTISEAPDTLLEGRTFTLEATAETTSEVAPTVFWTSLDSAVLAVQGDVLTGVAPGTGRVVASAGARVDTALVEVVPAPDAIVIDPDSTAILVGEQASFTAYVIDPRGDTLPGAVVTWSSATPTIVGTGTIEGTFDGLAPGLGIVQARAVADTTVVGTATLLVASTPADVGVAKTALTPTALIGDTVDFQIVVNNNSAVTLVGIDVADSLPAELTFASATPAGTLDAATDQWTWTLDTIPADGADTITVRATVNGGTLDGSYTNVARVSPPAGFADPNAVNDRATAAVTVSSDAPDLAVFATANDTTPAEGDTIQMIARVANLAGGGATPVTGVSMQAFAAVDLPLVLASPSQGSYDGLTDEWDIGGLAVGDTAVLTLSLEVPVGTSGSSIVTAAFISAVDQAQATMANDTASITLVVQDRNVDVEIQKTVDNPQPLQDSTVVFTVSVVNNGRGEVTDITVFDTLAAVFTAPAHTVSTGSLTNDSLWTIPTLAEGDTATWTTSTVIATGVAGTTASNTAILRSVVQSDSTPANDTAVVNMNFPISAVPMVTITEPSADTVIDPGELINFFGTATDPEDGVVTSSIEWVSSVDGPIGTGGSMETDQLSTGLHTISASVTDSDGGTGADTVLVTVALLSVPATLNVPFGGTASLPINLTEPAPTGGVTVDIISAAPSVTTPTTSTVFIPGGALAANATLNGVAPGLTTVTVSNPIYGGASTQVSVTAELDISATFLTVWETFPQTILVQLESSGTATPAPVGGLPVTLTSLDPSCVAVNTGFSVPGGFVSDTTTLAYGGSATLPCTAYVRASATSVTPDSVSVTVNATPTISVGAGTIGGGLQNGSFAGTLATASHGGVTVRVESLSPGVLLVSPNSTTVGTPFVDYEVADGINRVWYYLQGIEGNPDSTSVTLQISAPGFVTSTADLLVVTAGTQINSLSTTTTSFDPDDNFTVGVGVPNASRTSISHQAVRWGADSLVVTVASSDTTVGHVVTSADTADTVTVRIAPALSTTPGTVAGGGVAFSPHGVGDADVTATIPGFVPVTNATRTVSVSAPANIIGDATVGSGLQHGTYNARLGASAHGGVIARVESLDPALVLVSLDATTAGTAFVEDSVRDGSVFMQYVVHGLEGVTGVADIVFSAPGFVPDTASVTVEQGAFEISSLNLSSLTTLSPDDPFTVRVGLAASHNGWLTTLQAPRIGGDTLFATITATPATSGDLVTLADSASPVTVAIPPGAVTSATSVATGGVAFEPLMADTVTVTAVIPGLTATDIATREVAISAPQITAGSANTTFGSGLQHGLYRANLGASAHGGVTATVESLDPGLFLITNHTDSVGAASIDFDVADGASTFDYWLQGMDDVVGTGTLVVSAPGFVPDTVTVNVVQPAVEVSGLTTSLNTFSLDDAFTVRVGVPNSSHSFLTSVQERRPGGDTLWATITSDTAAVGVIVTQSGTAPTGRVAIAPTRSSSESSVATGGAAFDALSAGMTNVSVTIPNFIDTLGTSTRTVTVSAPTISVPATTVGGGLQGGLQWVTLGASAHGGVTVTIRSSNPDVMRVSPADSVAGTDSIQVDVPDGQVRAYYHVEGVSGVTGSVQITAYASGFTDGNNTVTVVDPSIEIIGLSTSRSIASGDDAFYARIGVSWSTNSSLQAVQNLAPGSAPLDLTFTSSDAAAATLFTESGGTSGTVVLQLTEGQSRTPTTVGTGGVALRPLAVGTTTVDVTAPGFGQTTAATVTVTINP